MPQPPKTFGAGGILSSGVSVCEWVGGSHRKPCEHYLLKREFRPILVTGVFGFLDVLIRFWGKRSKVKVAADGDITVDGSQPSSIWCILIFCFMTRRCFWWLPSSVTVWSFMKMY